jgi:hypothetical protein
MIEMLLAMDPITIATFIGAGVLLNLTPGADVVFASACGICFTLHWPQLVCRHWL